MTIGYKLVDADCYTRRGEYGETLWEVGSTVEPVGEGRDLCGPGVLHDYSHPLLAVLMAPVHGVEHYTRMLVLEHDGEPPLDDSIKRGTWHPVRVLREIPMPTVTTDWRVRVVIYAARGAMSTVGLDEPAAWTAWADGWLRGERDAAASDAASNAAWAAWAAAARDAWAAASDAAWAASDAARDAWDAASDAAWAAARAGSAAARAAARDAKDVKVDLAAICERAAVEEGIEWDAGQEGA